MLVFAPDWVGLSITSHQRSKMECSLLAQMVLVMAHQQQLAISARSCWTILTFRLVKG